MMYYGRSDESHLANYFKALPYERLFNPILSFTDTEVNFLKEFNPGLF